MNLLKEGGINYPIPTLIIFVLFILCSVAFSLIRAERTKSMSAKEMRVMDPIIHSLAAGMIVIFALLCSVLY